MNKFVIACVMCLAVASMASAGYTDSLWNGTEERIYYDCGDWSGVHNHKNTAFHFQDYGLVSWRHNGRYMENPLNWGYPEGTGFQYVCGLRSFVWTGMAIRGFDKTLNVGDRTYIDDPTKINYKTSCLRVHGDITIRWNTYKITHHVTKSDDGKRIILSNKVVFYAKKTNGLGEEERMEVTTIPSSRIEYTQWNPVNSTVVARLVNYSNYMILSVQTPENITGIKIIAESENATAVYEKHTCCLKLNMSESFMTCDLVDCKYHNFTEMIPFGPDTYLLQYEQDYDINVTLYTPFNTIDGVVTLNKTDAEPINTDLKYDSVWDLLYIAVPISLIIGLTRLT